MPLYGAPNRFYENYITERGVGSGVEWSGDSSIYLIFRVEHVLWWSQDF